ncbi:MAG TPA: 5-deoxy-glucuronate isomerase [Anaerolineales bacterium]
MVASDLLRHPTSQSGEYLRVTPEQAGWELLHFAARRLKEAESWELQTGENEYGIVVLGGVGAARSSRGSWESIGRREDVFRGMPHALYLPRHTDLELRARSDGLHLAYAWCRADQDHPARLIRPEDVPVEIRGGGNATRQINGIIPPGFDCQRLVCVEVYTPSGNWSSYPPHKHDQHRVSEAGELLEADLEEVYFYQMDRTEGYAIQRVYTADGRLDQSLLARHGDLVLVPEGYHPVVSAHGYTTYYLNFLAGSAQSLANSDDPAYSWVRSTWIEQDPRVPIVTLETESGGHASG